MLKFKLFRAIALTVVLFGLLSAYVGIRTLNRRIVDEAANRVRLDLDSARAVMDSELGEIGTVVRLLSAKESVVECCVQKGWDDAALQNRLEKIRITFGLDFLDVLTADGQAMLRTTPPHAKGDYRSSDPAVNAAMKGDSLVCMSVLSRREMANEGDGLPERAYFQVEETPRSRKTPKKNDSRGLFMVGAAPVRSGMQIVGVVYGGILVNRNFALVDRVHEVVYKDEEYKGRPLGTATFFLDDCRVSTTVRLENGNRALGTRVSKEVADQVLDNGQSWFGEAFVVNDWYLSAYEPLKDGFGKVVGMLYVGILKRPFKDYARSTGIRYGLLVLGVLCLALVIALVEAGRLANPIHRLVEASNQMRRGDRPVPVVPDGRCQETDRLVQSFNEMVRTLAEREERMKALNRSYMETLGFVSHELKSPVATIMNYSYLLREEKLGPLTEKQAKAVRSIDGGGKRLVEMVRHYLNLSRIENAELNPVFSRVAVRPDVLDPVLEALDPDLHAKGMVLSNEVPGDVLLHADLNLVHEVFENLIGNAIKYGRPGGRIRIGFRRVDGTVEFCVANEGNGIPPDRVGSLFQKFSRIESAPSAKAQKGTGLGLFITKYIVEAHGGRISVKSVVNEWTEFTFTLPAAREEPAATA